MGAGGEKGDRESIDMSDDICEKFERIRTLSLDNLIRLLEEAELDHDVLMKIGGANLIRSIGMAEDSLESLRPPSEDDHEKGLRDAERLHRELKNRFKES